MARVGWRSSQNVGEERCKSTDLGVIPTQSRDDLLYTIDETTLLASANRADQSPPCCDISAHDDILNSGFGEIAAGRLSQMSVGHQRAIELRRANFEHEPNGVTETRHFGEAEFRKLAGLEGCKSRATDTGGRGERREREPLGSPLLRDQVTDRR
jgi:hypothetical protein